MPKPAPDYLPVEIDDKAKSLGMTTYEYSEHLGLSRNRLYSFYAGKHEQFACYCQIADYAEISLEKLAVIAQEERWEALFERMKEKLKSETQTKVSNAKLAKRLGLSAAFISARLTGKKGLNGLHPYWVMSRVQGMDLDKLRKLCNL